MHPVGFVFKQAVSQTWRRTSRPSSARARCWTSSCASSAAAAAAASTPGLRIIRPSLPDIGGTDTERLYFHEFRRAAENGIYQHVQNDASFWKWTIPQLCLQEPAIRHAVVALGAAFRTYHLAEPRTPGGPPSQTEVFALDKYGQAMTVLGKMSREAPGVTATTLVCCLVFVAIECLLGNWEEALQHLRAGIAIIDSTVPIGDLMALADARGALSGTGQLASDTDYVVRMFSALELSACLFKDGFRPIIALKLLRARRAAGLAISDLRESGNAPRDVWSAHRAASQFARDACALSWEWNFEPQGDVSRECEELLAVGQELEWRLQRLSESPNASRPGTLAEVSMRIEMLHVTACKQLAQVSAPRSTSQPEVEAGFEEIVRRVGAFRRSVAAQGPEAQGRRFVIDPGIISSVHFVVYNCADARIRERALGHLRDWPRREHFWDGPEVAMLLEAGEEGGAELPKTVGGAAAIPALREKLAGLRIEEGDGEGGENAGKGKRKARAG
ncbi:hypothetical protein VUR80DRAFT_3427 [Thermomyces stellatus]